MKTLARLAGLGLVLYAANLQAQNISGTDDFSTVTGNWTDGTTANGGAFSVSGGLLNFTDGGVTTGVTSSAQRAWTLNAGSSVADWQVQLDLGLNFTQVAGQVSTWTLVFANSANNTDYFQVDFLRSYMQLNPFVRGTLYTNGSMGTQQQSDVTAAATVRIDYIASSQYLVLAYDADGAAGGYSFTDLYGGSVAGWGMGSTDTFALGLQASNAAMSGPASGILPGTFYADNFVATSTPIPEPASYAAMAGLIAMVGAGLWRRLRQQ
ncbi:MAG TPA: hypothetical protein VHD61_05320 [Lacunisphaera sp.]|nr:hypothetical protein [Lacunisphaera sp.]